MTSAGDATFAMPPSVLYRKVDGQMVLLNLDSEQYYGLNEVGAHIVNRITTEPFADAFAGLVQDYGIDETRLRGDIDNLVDDLIKAGLLHRVDCA